MGTAHSTLLYTSLFKKNCWKKKLNHRTLSPARNIEIDVGGVQEELLYKLYKFFSIGFTQENWMGGGRKLDEKSYKFKRFKGRINKWRNCYPTKEKISQSISVVVVGHFTIVAIRFYLTRIRFRKIVSDTWKKTVSDFEKISYQITKNYFIHSIYLSYYCNFLLRKNLIL